MRALIEIRATALLALAAVLLAGCEAPPPASTQQGFRGTGMVAVDATPLAERVAAEPAPPVLPPATPPAGPKASEIYQNVQLLGDLDIGSFTRLMTAITAWVAPDQGCAYCHEGADMASDSLYTKVVARRMIEMTRFINSEAQAHVGATGVTCHTCHRGQNVPAYVWTADDAAPGIFAGNRAGQNAPSAVPQYAALPVDPFSGALDGSAAIRVATMSALPADNARNIKDTETTYALMMHLSEALDVNCTFCHNTRAFSSWEESPPARVTAWHGIQMVRALNGEYVGPLAATLPAHRLGPTGDAPKVNCATCHQGLPKPLGGVSMIGDFPALQGR
ncbi:MAG: photosynthetic reaction center cytochrome PufC [Gammaproteobacteria bacterium]